MVKESDGHSDTVMEDVAPQKESPTESVHKFDEQAELTLLFHTTVRRPDVTKSRTKQSNHPAVAKKGSSDSKPSSQPHSWEDVRQPKGEADQEADPKLFSTNLWRSSNLGEQVSQASNLSMGHSDDGTKLEHGEGTGQAKIQGNPDGVPQQHMGDSDDLPNQQHMGDYDVPHQQMGERDVPHPHTAVVQARDRVMMDHTDLVSLIPSTANKVNKRKHYEVHPIHQPKQLFLSSHAEHNYSQLAAICKFSGNPVFR